MEEEDFIPQVRRLSDSVTLRSVKTDRFKSENLSVLWVCPLNATEGPLNTLLFSVLRRGTQKYPTLSALNQRLDELYAADFSLRNHTRGNNQIIGFSAGFLCQDFIPDSTDVPGSLLALMMEILYHPLTDENGLLLPRYVESEKENTINLIRSIKSNPRAYANACCEQMTYGYDGDPCGADMLGSEESVMAVTAESLTAHYHRMLRHISYDCFYVGRTDPSLMGERLLATLAGTGTKSTPVQPTRLRFSREEPVYREEEMPVGQGKLAMSFCTEVDLRHPLFSAMMVFNEMFGAGPTARLFTVVREQMSLCYYCSSVYQLYKGTLTVSSGFRNENREIVQAEILHQIALLAAGDFTEEELENAKKSLDSSYRAISDNAGGIESFYYGRMLLGVSQTVDSCRREFSAVTREQVCQVAALLRPDAVFVILGTAKEETEDGDVNDEE